MCRIICHFIFSKKVNFAKMEHTTILHWPGDMLSWRDFIQFKPSCGGSQMITISPSYTMMMSSFLLYWWAMIFLGMPKVGFHILLCIAKDIEPFLLSVLLPMLYSMVLWDNLVGCYCKAIITGSQLLRLNASICSNSMISTSS